MKHSKGAPVFTEAQIREHASKHSRPLPSGMEEFVSRGVAASAAVEAITGKKLQPYQKAILGIVMKARQNKTEKAFGLILESMKQRGELDDYKPFGIRLEWGAHPESGKPQIYSPDYTIRASPFYRLIEVKGPHIYPKDLIRFRGCRAEWGMWFAFEMWQRDEAGIWRRIE